MAHVGRIYPIQQDWRLYAGSAESLAGYPPKVMRFRTEFWVATFTAPAGGTWYECFPLSWSPGEYEITYKSSGVSSGGHTLEFGAVGKVDDDWFMRWRYAVWDNGVDQISWGWHDRLSHFAWHPGDIQMISTGGPSGATIYPVGNVEVMGKQWAMF